MFVYLHDEITSIYWTPERLLYITDVSQLQQRNYNNNNNKKKKISFKADTTCQ